MTKTDECVLEARRDEALANLNHLRRNYYPASLWRKTNFSPKARHTNIHSSEGIRFKEASKMPASLGRYSGRHVRILSESLFYELGQGGILLDPSPSGAWG